MLDGLLRILTGVDDADRAGGRNHPAFALAVLLIEVARSDDAVEAREQGLIERALARRFGLQPGEVTPLFTVQRGKRYRLAMNNNSGDTHPVHMHRHTFEVVKVGDKMTSGVMKDTINMPRFTTAEIDFIADDPGPTLFHCHHQDHQDEGFMGLIRYG